MDGLPPETPDIQAAVYHLAYLFRSFSIVCFTPEMNPIVATLVTFMGTNALIPLYKNLDMVSKSLAVRFILGADEPI